VRAVMAQVERVTAGIPQPTGVTLTLSRGPADPIFTFDSLTPGASYITASGLSYERTPEPATLFLFGTTVAGLGLARWKHRSQQ